MAVKVTTARGMNADSVKSFDKGKAILVNDGHLFVLSAPQNTLSATIAAFAPSEWVEAEVTD